QREYCHRLGRGGDVESGLPGQAVVLRAEADDDAAQRPVVHIEHPAPGDVAQVDPERVAPMQVVVEHCGQLVVRGGDRVHVTGQVQVQRSEEHTSELQSLTNLVCRLLLEKKKHRNQSVVVEASTPLVLNHT